MRLEEIVETSRQVGSTRARLIKIDRLASCLRHAGPAAVKSAVALLSGVPRQGRIGVGWATLQAARAEAPAGAPTLTLADLDAALDRFSGVKGKGAAAERARAAARAVRARDRGRAGLSRSGSCSASCARARSKG